VQAASYADQAAEIAGLSATLLFPCTTAAAAADSAGGSGNIGDSNAQQSGLLEPNPLFNTRALQLWILRGCQQLKGGLRDKPGKSADYYHTCYCLSGLSAAQHIMGGGVVGPAEPAALPGGSLSSSSSSGTTHKQGALLGSNDLAAADPLLNVVVDRVQEAKRYFEAAQIVE
jgi:prenyltransferase beta subunit